MPLMSRSVRTDRSPSHRWLQICRAIRPFSRRHQRWFVAGTVAALFVVGIRLVLPWPLRALMEPWLGHSSGKTVGLLVLVPGWLNPTLAMGGLFLVLILSLGFADYLERLHYARFAIGSIRDLRAEAFKQAAQLGPEARGTGSGDLVARLIGDTARLKAGLKGFLVHVATNGVMFIGVTAVLLWIDLTLGLVFVAAGVFVGLATTWGAAEMFHRALKYRTKEGKLADFIHESSGDDPTTGAFAEVNRSSGQHEAALTHIQGRTTWSAHIVLGIAVVTALIVGVQALSRGRLAAGDLFVLMMYALMIRAPIVQLARQGARTGKILACGDRLERLLAASPHPEPANVQPLRDELHIDGARVATRRARTRVRRVGPIDLRIPAGQRLAILGKPGSGKTTLLELIAGAQPIRDGRVLWDGMDLYEGGAAQAHEEIALLQHSPTWPRCRVRDLLRVGEGPVDESTQMFLRACGANSLLKRLPGGLDTKLASSDVSPRERAALALATLARGTASLWLLDDPVAGLDKRKARKLIKRVLETRPEATVVVALSRPVRLRRFDRVIVLKRGNVVFDGTPDEWRAASKDQNALESELKEESAPRTGGEGVL